MASSASQDSRPDIWPDLSALGPTEANGHEARAKLLTINAEMFVAAPARDREAIDTFESLALGFLPTIDEETLAEIARILTPCPDTPEAVIAYLLKHSAETRDIVIGHSRYQPADSTPAMFGTSEGRMALASRAGIDAETAWKLLVLEEDVVDDVLAANRSFVACEDGFDTLLDRGRRRASLAHILLARDDLAEHAEAALYLAASQERRSEIQERLAASLSHRRAVLSFSLATEDVETLSTAARKNDAREMEAFLTTAFGFPDGTEWRLLQIGRHDLIALALKALDVGPRDAARILMELHPALAHPLSTIKKLIRIVRDMESNVALALVEAILGVRALSADD